MFTLLYLLNSLRFSKKFEFSELFWEFTKQGLHVFSFLGFQETTLVTLCCPGFFQAPVSTSNFPRFEKHGRIFHTIFLYLVSGILYFGIGRLLRMELFIEIIKSPRDEDARDFWRIMYLIYFTGIVLHTFFVILYYKVLHQVSERNLLTL